MKARTGNYQLLGEFEHHGLQTPQRRGVSFPLAQVHITGLVQSGLAASNPK